MTETMIDTEDPGAPAMLDTKDVAEMFKRHNLAIYAEARRTFYRKINISPFKRRSPKLLRLIEWSFWDWFAFDCSITGLVTGNDCTDLRLEFEDDQDEGISPFLSIAEFLHRHDDRVGERQMSDFLEIDSTNFASVFWINDANAATGLLDLEDIIHGGEYMVDCPPVAAQYDGAHGGMIVNRIARARGAWRQCAIPLYEARRPDSPEAKRAIASAFCETRQCPDFADLVRFFYGRTNDTGLDWEDMAAAVDSRSLRHLVR
ncbi:hypothetical protein [Bifidobacterium oedipodis]|uniref:Uncharacterized protein n=1 Tax=Bifidobacterium oedipodis TaxID=2675322 RepID=A0A7Y0ENY7_9BIFI|nr:hypothetical protein [Bifidobacterium sp. DSM 109957]NMM93726.1 hypothetical protein [Bifidobacterium sp. DSM 109957]